MKNRILMIVFAVAICLTCFRGVTVTAQAATVDDLSFKLNDDGRSYCVNRCETSASGAIEIPATYNGLPVTAIGWNAFMQCADLQSITIPDSVTSICGLAFFECDNLRSITIPDSVTSIGDSVFGNCDNLKSVTMTDSVTSLGRLAFNGCKKLQSVTLSDNISLIDREMFEGCKNLPSIVIPDGVTKIGMDAFSSCSSLKSVSLPAGITEISYKAFENCEGITDVYFRGTESQWEQVKIYPSNDNLISANIHFESEKPTEPVTDTPTQQPAADFDNEKDENSSTVTIIAVTAGGVVALAGVSSFVVIRKRRVR